MTCTPFERGAPSSGESMYEEPTYKDSALLINQILLRCMRLHQSSSGAAPVTVRGCRSSNSEEVGKDVSRFHSFCRPEKPRATILRIRREPYGEHPKSDPAASCFAWCRRGGRCAVRIHTTRAYCNGSPRPAPHDLDHSRSMGFWRSRRSDGPGSVASRLFLPSATRFGYQIH